MDNVIYPLVALLALGVLLFRLPVLWRERDNPARQAFAAMLVFLILGFTFGAPIVKLPFDDLVGVPNLSKLLQYAFKMAAALCIQRLLTHWAYPAEEARRRGRQVLVVFAVAEAALAYFFIVAPVDVETADFSTRYATTPGVVEFKAVFLATLAYAIFNIMRLSWRYARVAGRPFLRRGLRLIAYGGCFGVAHQIISIAFSLAKRFDLPMWSDKVQGNMTPITGGGGALLIISGLVLPSLGPQLAVLAALVRRYRTHQRLRPLWQMLVRATPTIALETPSRLSDWLKVRDVQYRLVRRLVEIRDGRLALEPFLDEDVAEATRAAGQRVGVAGEQLDATVEAALLRHAVELKAADARPARVSTLEVHGGDDVEAEAGWLLQVSQGLRSPLARAAQARQDEPAAVAATDAMTSSKGTAADG